MARPPSYEMDEHGNFQCKECKRKGPEVKHASKGLCRGCRRKLQVKEYKENPPEKIRWALEYDECVNCHSDKHAHHARGLCISCYSTTHRTENIDKYHKTEQVRREIPENREKQKIQNKRWYKKNRKKYIAATILYRKSNTTRSKR